MVRAEIARTARHRRSSSRSSSSATGPAGRRPRDREPRPPVVVLLGGPVGRARRVDRVRDGDRRCAGRRRATPSSQVLIDLDGALVVAAGRPSARRTARRPPTTTRPRSAPTARSPVGAALDRLAADPAGAGRRSSRSTARSARTARSRRCSRRPASPTPGPASPRRRSAWTRRSSSGCAAASACRSSTGARSAPRAGRPTRDAVRAELEAFAAGAGDPRLMVKPARLGSSVGMTLVHDAGGARRRARPGLPLRHARARRDLPRGRPRPRGLGHRQRPGRARAVRPGRDRRPATSSTTTPPSTRPGLSETSTRGRGDRRPARHRSSRSPATPTGRSAPRASPGSTSCSPASAIYLSEINTIPGFTPISLFPTLPAAAGYTFADVCVRVVDLALERHAAAGRPPARAGRTCRDERPAGRAPTRSPTGRGPADAARPARLGRPVAGPRRARPSSMLARGRGDLRRRRRRPPSTTRRSGSTGADFTDAAAVSRRRSPRSAARTCSGSQTGAARGRARDARRPSTDARVDVELPDTLAVTLEERAPILVWQVGDRRFLVDATGRCSPQLAGRAARRRRPACRSSTTAGRRRPASIGRLSARPGRPRRRDPARLARARPTSAARPTRLAVSADRRERLRRQPTPGRLDGGLRLLHAEPADARAHPGPGPPAAQPARRARAARRAGHPRLGDRRDVHRRGRRPSPTASAEAERGAVSAIGAVDDGPSGCRARCAVG